MGKQSNPKTEFDKCTALKVKNTATHLAFVTLLSSQFMSGAVATQVSRSVQFLGKEGQCSSAVLWSNDYNSITNKI